METRQQTIDRLVEYSGRDFQSVQRWMVEVAYDNGFNAGMKAAQEIVEKSYRIEDLEVQDD